jgi:hypothetical protein
MIHMTVSDQDGIDLPDHVAAVSEEVYAGFTSIDKKVYGPQMDERTRKKSLGGRKSRACSNEAE